jgi:ribonuclease P protein component
MQRERRLRRPADFQRVRAMRRSWGHPLLVLYVAPNDARATRLGISVGKRVGKAVVRNLVKRRVREAVRHRYADVLPGHDLVFIARAPAATAPWPALRDATDDLLRRAKVLARPSTRGGAAAPPPPSGSPASPPSARPPAPTPSIPAPSADDA